MLILLNLFTSLSITVGAYLFIPMIILFCCKKFSLKTLKIIAIINAAVIFILFNIMNYFLEEGPANFGACMLWGVLSYRLMKRYCYLTTSTPNNSSDAMNVDSELEATTEIKAVSEHKPTSKPKASNVQRVFNVIVTLFIIASVGINIFLFTEIQRYNSQQEKLIDNVNYLVSSNEKLLKSNEELKTELGKISWRSKINAFSSEELEDALGRTTAKRVKADTKDWDFLRDIAP